MEGLNIELEKVKNEISLIKKDIEFHTHQLNTMQENIKKYDTEIAEIKYNTAVTNKTTEQIMTSVEELKEELKEYKKKKLEEFDGYKKSLINVILTGVGGAIVGAISTFLIK